MIILFPLFFAGTVAEKNSDGIKEKFNQQFRIGPFVKTTSTLDKNLHHSVIFSIKQRNLDELERILYEVSDPDSPNYGQHRTSEEVANLTSNPYGAEQVKSYLTNNRIKILEISLHGDFITASAPIHIWEKIFDTTFHIFHHEQDDSKYIHRAESMKLHDDIEHHISSVFHVKDFPLHVEVQAVKPIPYEDLAQAATLCTGYLTPSTLSQIYHIDSNDGQNQASIGIYSAGSNYFSSTDISTFQTKFGIPLHPVDYDPYSRNDPTCTKGTCNEADLDVEFISGIAQNIPITMEYDSASAEYITWLSSIVNKATRASVYSISYSAPENWLTGLSNMAELNTLAMKLGVLGVTLVASTGDDGAMGRASEGCGYGPMFPASSPYVTAVGGTMGPEAGTGTIESACDANKGGTITSSGGFSNYAALSFQTNAINTYFMRVASTPPKTGYNRNGRGIPDVSLAARCYRTVINGKDSLNFGTSASTPAFASMVALVNAARKKAGKSYVGWINPTLYASGGSFANDIGPGGDNKCSRGWPTPDLCCSEGFATATGWDPVTGFGSVDFKKFYNLFMGITTTSSSVPSRKPTGRPSKKPTNRPAASQPSKSPSKVPTRKPSGRPTLPQPSKSPSKVPTRKPSGRPTLPQPSKSPSKIPTRKPSGRPTLPQPSKSPSKVPTRKPSGRPTLPQPSKSPSKIPTRKPSGRPTLPQPSKSPSKIPTRKPSSRPTLPQPSKLPSKIPTKKPSIKPTL
eukprot:gene2197-4272_t